MARGKGSNRSGGRRLNPENRVNSEGRGRYPVFEEEEESEQNEDDESSYEVEAIMDKKVEDNMNHYLVSWKGYSVDEATWEPISNLNNCSALIFEFEMRQLPQKERNELAYDSQSYSSPSYSQAQYDTYSPLPQDIYSYNLQILGNGQPTIAQLERISSELDKQLKQNLPVSAELISILGFEPDDPDHFRVRARTQAQTRTYRIHKSRLQREHSQALIEYYQSLIEWD